MSEHCAACTTPYKPDAAFCARCGTRRPVPVAIALDAGGFSLHATLVLFFAMLATGIGAAIHARVTERAFHAVVVGTVAIAVVALVAAIPARRLVGPALRGFGLGARGTLAMLGAAPLLVGAVVLYVHLLHGSFGLHVDGELDFLEGRSLAWALLVVVVLAPVGEELAFRGLVFPGLRRSLGRAEAYAITAFAFAILHMSVPALVTHVPLGLYFCFLRERSGRLWPPLVAHVLHNAGVVVYELARAA